MRARACVCVYNPIPNTSVLQQLKRGPSGHPRLRSATLLIYIYIYIYHHHHHNVALVARISLTLSHHSSLSFIALGRSSGQHSVSSHSC